MSWWLARGTFKWTFDWKIEVSLDYVSPLKAASTCMSLKTQELCWQRLELLAGSTKLDGSWGRNQTKGSPWPSRLRVGFGANYPTL